MTAKSCQLIQLTKVLDHYNENGFIYKKKTKENKTQKNRSSDSGGEEFLWRNFSCSLRKAPQQISPTKTTLWRIVRHDLRFRFYHYTSVQPLTDAHKAQRRQFCQWILQQPSNIVDRITWTDEKFFLPPSKTSSKERRSLGKWKFSKYLQNIF